MQLRSMFFAASLTLVFGEGSFAGSKPGPGIIYYGSGSSYSSYSTRLSDAERRFLENQVEDGNRFLEEIQSQNRILDATILGVQSADIAIGIAASSVPYGGLVYSTSKTVTYAAIGDTEAAVISSFGIFTSSYAAITPAASKVTQGVGFIADAIGLSDQIGRVLD